MRQWIVPHLGVFEQHKLRARARPESWEGLGKRWEALGGVKCLDACCAHDILKNVIKTLY